MIRSIISFSVLFLSAASFSQTTIKKHVIENHSRIASISNDTNYSGFEALDKAIAGKRVVMLGEQDHGDATAFIAKTKIIKYLHEKKGFNVLAFESDFFSLTEGQKGIKNDTANFRLYMQNNIFPIWTECNGCSDLFYDYLPKQLLSANPITVTGFDSQPHGAYARLQLYRYLDSALNSLQATSIEFKRIKEKVADHTDSLIKNFGSWLPDVRYYDGAANWYQQAIDIWQEQKGKDYTWRLLNSLKGFNQQVIDREKEFHEMNKARDVQMAANLDWLVNEKYKNEKIIVWAANAHVIKNVNAIMKHHFKTMGTHFCDDPRNAAQTYVLGFTSGTGVTGRLAGGFSPYAVNKPDRDSFENWFGETAFVFADLSSYQNATKDPESFKLKGINHQWNGKLQWSISYDGVFYIRKMEPCISISK